MTPISQMTVGELISSIRDLTVILGTLTIGWKVRSWVQPLVDFFKRANTFFDMGEKHIQRVEAGMNVLLNNHLHHIQADLGHISGRDMRPFVQVEAEKPQDVAPSIEV